MERGSGTAKPRVSSESHTYIWAYRVKPDSLDAFLEHYGPEGRWVELFRRAEDYLGTELLRDRAEANRYVTIDRWSSAEAFAKFRSTFASEFEQLDRHCESFTEQEREIGTFGPVEGQGRRRRRGR